VAFIDLEDVGQRADGSEPLAVRVLESCTGQWQFDTGTRRFRHLPPGLVASLSSGGWQPYVRLEVDAGGTFTVVLNEAGTRMLRATAHPRPCAACGAR
jgi:hypothetical protein